jgi:hypothetical protein
MTVAAFLGATFIGPTRQYGVANVVDASPAASWHWQRKNAQLAQVDETQATSGGVAMLRQRHCLPITSGTADNQLMSRRFQFSLGWGIVGAFSGDAIRFATKSRSSRIGATRVFAGAFGIHL